MAKKQPVAPALVYDINELQARLAAGHVVDVSSAKTPEDAQAILDAHEESELMKYEQHAIKGLVEMLPEWYTEGGLPCVLQSLAELMHRVDAAARAADEATEIDSESGPAQRRAIAEEIRIIYRMSRRETRQALEFLTGHPET